MILKMLSVKQAADLVGISPDMIRSEIKTGRLVSKKAGKTFFTTPEWLESWQNEIFKVESRKNTKTFKYPKPTKTAKEIGDYYISLKKRSN